MKKHILCFVAGKSGGHIIPCLTMAEHYKKQHPQAQIIFFSTNTPLDTKLLAQHPLLAKQIPFKLNHIWHLARAFFTSIYYLHKLKPQKVISTGGLVSVPVCIAAKLLRIPIELHELNAVPGRATKFLAPLAQSIFVCFKKAQEFFPQKKCSIASYPIRYTHKQSVSPQAARTKLKLGPHRKTIFILGGSQGSVFINNVIKQILEDNDSMRNIIQVIHQTGSHDKTNWADLYQHYNIPAHVFPYANNLADCYTAADLIICRAGAGTLFEALFFNKPCIAIPLETKSTAHQLDNARTMTIEQPELFCVLRQRDIEAETGLLSKHIKAWANGNSLQGAAPPRQNVDSPY